jgi:hypothetical protein
MLFRASYDIVLHFVLAIRIAFWPTLLALWKSPTLLLNPPKFSRILFANIWVGFGPATDENWKQVKEKLITPNAYGVVLDIGAGKPVYHTHSIIYYSAHYYLFRLRAHYEIP